MERQIECKNEKKSVEIDEWKIQIIVRQTLDIYADTSRQMERYIDEKI